MGINIERCGSLEDYTWINGCSIVIKYVTSLIEYKTKQDIQARDMTKQRKGSENIPEVARVVIKIFIVSKIFHFI